MQNNYSCLPMVKFDYRILNTVRKNQRICFNNKGQKKANFPLFVFF